MDEKKRLPRPEVVKVLGVSRAASIAAVFSGLLILVGIIESTYFLKLNLTEITIMSCVLFVFYVILLMVLLKPRVIKIIRRVPGKKMADMSKKPAIEDIKKEVSGIKAQRPVIVNINNQTAPKTRKKAKKKSVKKKRK